MGGLGGNSRQVYRGGASAILFVEFCLTCFNGNGDSCLKNGV